MYGSYDRKLFSFINETTELSDIQLLQAISAGRWESRQCLRADDNFRLNYLLNQSELPLYKFRLSRHIGKKASFLACVLLFSLGSRIVRE